MQEILFILIVLPNRIVKETELCGLKVNISQLCFIGLNIQRTILKLRYYLIILASILADIVLLLSLRRIFRTISTLNKQELSQSKQCFKSAYLLVL